MIGVMECVAVALKNRGLRGLCEVVPGGQYLYDVAGEVFKLYRERKKLAMIRQEIAQAAAATTEEAKKAAEDIAKQVAHDAPLEERIALELYLTQIPNAVRQSLKRAEDPSGKTVPPDIAVNEPEDLAKMLPLRVPQFRTGNELPGRPGWRLDELLGAGGFGEVWLARHSFIPLPRAVKFCTDPKVRAKLTSHEGRVVARVMEQGYHPNVVPLLDAVLEGETPWLMYEYVGGGNLTDLIHRWQTIEDPVRESLAILALKQLASAVGTFHRLTPAIVHRDLKPANILVSAELKASNMHTIPLSGLRVTDFGIGGVAVDYLRANTNSIPTGIPLTGSLLTGIPITGWLETSLRGSYTPLYASPQQARGAKPDPRDDVHALGVIAFQMLTGKLTEAPGTRFERELRKRGVSDAFIDLIGDCVDSEPNGRPQDAFVLAERLHLLEQRAPAKPQAISTPTTPQATSTPTPPQAQATSTAQPNTTPEAPKPQSAQPQSAQPKAQPPQQVAKKPVTPTPLEGGSATTTILPIAEEIGPSKWLIPLRATLYTRPTDRADSQWIASNTRLPGEMTAKPGEAYRLTLNPDTTGDEELAKLRALSGLPGLEAIDLTGCVRVTDKGVMQLANLRGLKAIGLGDTQVTDSGVTLLLTRFPELEAVGLAGAENVSQSVIPYLTRMRKLKLLALPPRADTGDVRAEFAKRAPACQLV
jgi:serine/threonine protein kinase